MSFRTYTARRRLNRLRRAACQLFTSDSMVKAIQRLELEVEAKRLLVRKDRHLWKDIGERQKVLNWLLSYNPLWLRIGLETIFGELIPLESNSDVMGLAMFILGRLLWNPDIAAEFRHPKVPHLYRDGHEEALSRFTLKKLLLLVCFLDKAKESRLIEHDPCLFCMDAEYKVLTYLNYLLSAEFTAFFTEGEKLKSTRDQILLGLTVYIYMNVYMNVCIEYDIILQSYVYTLFCGRLIRIFVYIVDGHREKTLNLLWKIIFTFQVEVLLDVEHLKEEISFLKKTWRTKQKLAWLKADKCAVKRSNGSPRAEQSSEKLTLLLDWVNAVCEFYSLKAENFTVSFSDGRILCYLIHHYHPNHLNAEKIHQKTTQTIECDQRGKVELNSSSSDSDCSFDSLEQNGSPAVDFKVLLENERSNFQLVNTAVSYLGGVPAMISPEDMSNTIPNEKVVTCYLSFLCARLLDLRNETRAARVIQSAWRRYKLQKDIQLNKQRNMAACKIQAVVKSFLQKRRLKRRNRAATVIQAFWRGYSAQKELKRMKEAKRYTTQNRAAVLIQTLFRGYSVRHHIAKMHKAATTIQAALRMHKHRSAFKRQCWAAGVLQERFRAWKCGHQQRQRYLQLKDAAICMQKSFRGKQARDLVRLIKAASTIQSYLRMSIQRRQFMKTKAAVVLIQSAYRGHYCRVQYARMQKSAVLIQQWYRSRKLVQKHRDEFKRIQKATLTLQRALRRMVVKETANALRRQRFTAAAYHHLCAVRIQRALRTHWALKAAKKQISSVIYVQRWFKAKFQRKRYLEQRQKIITAQRAVKAWLNHRNQAATVIQHAAKRFLLRRKKERLKQGILKVQALWRGHCSRKLHDTTKVISMRHRFRKVNSEAKEEDKLCNKTATALSYLLGYQNYAYILAALKHLETATRLSPECCERLVNSGATRTIFTLIRSCNRSVPSMEIITLAIQVLLNLSKYNKTIDAVYEVPDSVDTLLDLLQIYREKAGDKVADKGGSIFTKACFLLVILVQDERRAIIPRASDRICSIYKLTLRKYKMDVQRTKVKQRMNVSLNGSFLPQATPQKSKFAPEWVLHRGKMKDIVDPLGAIQMLVKVLALMP
uniref:Calponin-homology (CH) domain-containing protein n=1 Tax=Astyanax mexicanus TaxID=7994 RepID=A0A3B1KFX3_ASTMX